MTARLIQSLLCFFNAVLIFALYVVNIGESGSLLLLASAATTLGLAAIYQFID